MNKNADTETTTVPCGWCDEPVIVSDDHGQIVYCTETHERLDGYVPVDAL
jgi:hypothetical protein